MQPDAGSILIDGVPVGPLTPQEAKRHGLAFIHQELAFVPGMTVLENIMLGVPKERRFGLVDWKTIAARVRPIASRVGIRADLNATVRGLSTSENWLISICRALVHEARLIVMDEPTASLSAAESTRLFDIVRDLSSSGVAILYVSHRLDEITDLCDRVTVFRDGRLADRIGRDDLTRERLVHAIIGAELERQPHLDHREEPMGAPILVLRGLARAPAVKGVDLELRRGEVLGLGGLVGAGRTELARLIFGADRPDAGAMDLDGGPYRPRSPGHALKAGVGYVPEERRADGLLLTKSIAFNLTMANLNKVILAPGTAARFFPQATDTGRRDDHGACGQGRRPGSARGAAVGRQPAEGGHRPLAGPAARRSDPRRADPRRGRGRAGRDPPPHPPLGFGRDGGAGDLVRTRRTAGSVRPCDGDGRGAHREGTERRRRDPFKHRRRKLRRTGSLMSLTDYARRMSPRSRASLGHFSRFATIIGLVAMIVVFSILSPRAFPSIYNFTNVLNQASLVMILAGGLTLAVIVGELDLSVGFAASLHGILATGLIVHNQLPIPAAVILVLLGGALIGVINGLIVTKLRVNSVIATLGTGTIITGLAFAYSAGVPIVAGVPEAFLQLSLGRWLFGIPNNIVVMLFVLGILWVLVEKSALGQEIQAVGGNAGAARLSGIDVDRIKIVGFTISGICAALTGILLASRLGSGTTSAGDSYLLTAFAAVFLGSATLRDGEFHVLGTFIGALIIAFGFNGLNIFGAPTFSQYIFQGSILIIAVGLSSMGRMLAES